MARLKGIRWVVVLLFVAVTLPGATSAAQTPNLQDAFVARLAAALGAVPGLLFAGPRAVAPASIADPALALESARTETAGRAAGVPPAAAVEADRFPLTSARTTTSVFQAAQVVSVYGHPDVPVMGVLGKYSPAEAAAEAARLAAEWDARNGARDAVGALHLIVDVAQPWPMADGSYLERMSAERIEPYRAAAREHGVLLFLDLQLGMSDPLTEVRRLTPFLVDDAVHVALDPEFAMRGRGGIPGETIGSLDAADVNAVQDYLDDLVRTYGLPPKVLVLHQFRTDMLTNTAALRDVGGVTRIIDMDGWGGAEAKLSHYEAYSLAAYSQRPAIKLFYAWDEPLLTPERLLALPRVPDLVIYQ